MGLAYDLLVVGLMIVNGIPMKTRSFTHVALVAYLATGPIACTARPGPGPSPPNRGFDTGPVAAFEGRVTGVNDAVATGVGGQNAVVTLELGGKPPVVVHLAPGWHLDRHGLHFSREDLVMGIGMPASETKGSELFARSIEKGDIKLELRDEKGNPLWPEKPPAKEDAEP